MNQTLILIFFFATAPVALMPSVIALLTRHTSRAWVVAANLSLWSAIFVLAQSFTLDLSSVFRLPTYLALIAWLTLLGWSVRGPTSRATRTANPRDIDAQ